MYVTHSICIAAEAASRLLDSEVVGAQYSMPAPKLPTHIDFEGLAVTFHDRRASVLCLEGVFNRLTNTSGRVFQKRESRERESREKSEEVTDCEWIGGQE